jgi:hypothetical protein
MKKLTTFFISILLLISLTSCNTNIAQTYNSQFIDNGYNNSRYGGRMAYLDGDLYITFISHNNLKTFGTYKFNNDGVTQVLTDNNNLGDDFTGAPYFYQTSDKIYVLQNGKITDIDGNTSELDSYFLDDSAQIYISNTLLAYVDESEFLHIKYKDNETYSLEEQIDSYYIYDNIVYFFDIDGKLYMNELTKGNPKSTLIDKLFFVDQFIYCNGDIYFVSDLDKDESGLYKYSLKENKYDLVAKGEINSINSYNNVIYYSTNSGVFSYKDGDITKITGRSAIEIYLLDEDYIYAVENSAGNVYRVTLDGTKTEGITFMK